MATSPASPPETRPLSPSGAAPTAIRVRQGFQPVPPRLGFKPVSKVVLLFSSSGRANGFGVLLGIARCLHEDKEISTMTFCYTFMIERELDRQTDR